MTGGEKLLTTNGTTIDTNNVTTDTTKAKNVILVLLLTSFIMSSFGFGRNIFPMIITDMKNDLNMTYTIIGVITALHQVGYLIFSYLSGKFTVRFGAARLSVGAVIISGLSLLLLGIVNNVLIIGILIGILGICAATSWVPMISIVNQYISEKHLSKSVGLISSGTSYGVFISGSAIPYLLKGYGWKSVWIVSGSVVLTIGLLGCIYLYWIGAFRIKGIYKKGLAKTVLANKKYQIIHVSVLMFLTGLALIPFQTYLIPYLRGELYLSVELGGRVWNIIGLIGMFSGILIGMLADKISARKAFIFTYLLIAVSSILLYVYPTPLTILVSGFLFGLGYYGLFAQFPVYINKEISKEYSASIFGITNLCLGIGSALGNYLGGWSKSLTNSFLGLYLTISMICVVLIFLSIKLKEKECH